MMHEPEKSDLPIVAEKPANKSGRQRQIEGQVYGIRVIRGAVHQRRTEKDWMRWGWEFRGPVAGRRVCCWRRSAITRNP